MVLVHSNRFLLHLILRKIKSANGFDKKYLSKDCITTLVNEHFQGQWDSVFNVDKPEIYQMGSLSDIAYCVPLKYLKYGIIIANNDADYQCLKKRCETLGFEVGNHAECIDIQENKVNSLG